MILYPIAYACWFCSCKIFPGDKNSTSLDRTFLHDAWYILSGKLNGTEKNTHPSIFEFSSENRQKTYLRLFIVLTSCVLFTVLMYLNIYLYKNFTDAFNSSSPGIFNQILMHYVGLTVVLVSLRAITKFVRKSTQNFLTLNIRKQWLQLYTSVNLDAIKTQDKQQMPQIIEEEVDETVSYTIITLTQALYMSSDLLFFFVFLYQQSPQLLFLAIGSCATIWALTYLPGAKQFDLQTKDRKLRTNSRQQLTDYMNRSPMIKGVNASNYEKQELNDTVETISTNYFRKITWESIYSFITRMIKYLSIPAAFFLIAPSYSTGTITFGVVMSSMRIFKDFLSSITLMISNRKMLNKFRTGVNRLHETSESIYKQRSYERESLSQYFKPSDKSKELALAVPACAIKPARPHNKDDKEDKAPHKEEEQLIIKLDKEFVYKPGVHIVKGDSGTGKSQWLSFLSGAFTTYEGNNVDMIQEGTKVSHPCVSDNGFDMDGQIYHISQKASECKKSGNTIIDCLRYPGNRYFKGIDNKTIENRFNQYYEDGIHKIAPKDIGVNPNNLSGGQGDSVNLIRLMILLDEYKDKPEDFPFKMVILDEIDRGFGQEKTILSPIKSVHGQPSRPTEPQTIVVYKKLAEKMIPFLEETMFFITSHHGTTEDEIKKAIYSTPHNLKTVTFTKDGPHSSVEHADCEASGIRTPIR